MKTVRVRCNPRCVKCARYARMHYRRDWLGRVEDLTASPLPRRLLRMGEVFVEDLRTGLPHAGAAGMRLRFRQVPAYWPLLPLFALPGFRRRVDADTAGAGGHDSAA